MSDSKKPFRQYFYRGIEAEKLLTISEKDFVQLVHARARRCFKRGSINEHLRKRLTKAKAQAVGEEKPRIVKTHLRNAVILPEMLGSQIGVYNGLGYHLVEVKPQMVGHYLGEFSLTYTPVRHGGKAAASTAVQKFIDLK